MRLRVLGWVCAVTAFALTASTPASAFERQWHLGGGIGAGAFHFHGQTAGGPLIEGAASYGLTDQFNLLAEIGASSHSIKLTDDQPHSTVDAITTSTGLAYTLDVLRVVPYAGATIGAQYLRAGSDFGGAFKGDRGAQIALDLGLAVGVDYQYTRDVSFGAAFREHFGVLGHDNTTLTTFTLRAQYTFGY